MAEGPGLLLDPWILCPHTSHISLDTKPSPSLFSIKISTKTKRL